MNQQHVVGSGPAMRYNKPAVLPVEGLRQGTMMVIYSGMPFSRVATLLNEVNHLLTPQQHEEIKQLQYNLAGVRPNMVGPVWDKIEAIVKVAMATEDQRLAKKLKHEKRFKAHKPK